MKLIKRSDGCALNLDAAITFMPIRKNMIVTFSNDETYKIINFNLNDINSDMYYEWCGWPEEK